jgi:SAM-dependent methyltransferase
VTVHPTAAQGFVRPDVYERGRPGYPQGAVDALGLSAGSVVADLGCGTGKITGQLAATGARVVGIEPLEAMLETFRTMMPGIEALSGTAEAIPAGGGTFDVVVCASAFHWFDHSRAIGEIHRVLKPNGRLAIVWNRRDRLEGWSKAFWEITEAHRGDTPGYRDGVWRPAIETSGLFGPIAEQHFEHTQRTDLEGLLARVGSISFIETLPAEAKQRVIDGSRRFLQTHPETRHLETFDLPYRTALYVTERAGG